MRLALTVSSAALALCLAGCGGASDAEVPTCAPGELKVSGTLDGKEISQTLTLESYAFGNASTQSPGELIIPVQDPQQVHIFFTRGVANGFSVPATGQVDLSATGGPVAQNCDGAEEPSTYSMDQDGDGATFVLRHLHADASCASPELEGSLAGCARFPVQ